MIVTTHTNKTVGDAIRDKRKEKGLTQTQLAKIVGVTPGAISRWETSDREPTVAMYEKIMKAMGVEIVAFDK